MRIHDHGLHVTCAVDTQWMESLIYYAVQPSGGCVHLQKFQDPPPTPLAKHHESIYNPSKLHGRAGISVVCVRQPNDLRLSISRIPLPIGLSSHSASSGTCSLLLPLN